MVLRSVVEHMNGAFMTFEIRISSLLDGMETILFIKQLQHMAVKMFILFMTRGYWDVNLQLLMDFVLGPSYDMKKSYLLFTQLGTKAH